MKTCDKISEEWCFEAHLLQGLVLAALCLHAATSTTSAAAFQLVSHEAGVTNTVANGDSLAPVMTGDGRYIAFVSSAANLVTNDGNGHLDVFLHDRESGGTVLISQTAAGMASGNGPSFAPAVNPGGRHVAFQSRADDLVPGDGNGQEDIFVRDTFAGTTTLVSVNRLGTASGNGSSFNPQISEDGRYILFESLADDLVANDSNVLQSDIFLRDLTSGTTWLVNVNASGSGNAPGYSVAPSMTPDARYVAFESSMPTLASNDSNVVPDIFVRDRLTLTNILVTVGTNGLSAGRPAWNAVISRDGSLVAFEFDGRLTPDDTTGRSDIYLRDLKTRTTRLVSLLASPAVPGMIPTGAVISRDGDMIAYYFTAQGSTVLSGQGQVYAWSAGRNTNLLISVGFDGSTPGSGISHDPLISANNRYVSFISNSTNLVTNAVSGRFQVYQRDLANQVTRLVSPVLGAGDSSPDCFGLAASDDGREVAFGTRDVQLIANDRNQSYDIFVARLAGDDSDSDGMEDDWERTWFGSLARDGSGDFDQDGSSDLGEYRAGTQPTNESSVLRARTVTSILTANATVWWDSIPGKTYRIEFLDTLSQSSWSSLPQSVTASSTVCSLADDSPTRPATRFYRVRLVEP